MHAGTRSILFALGALFLPHFASAQELELSVRNRTQSNMTVFALWESRNGTRARLGDVRPNQTSNFTIDVEGQRVTLTVQVAGNRTRVGGTREDWYAPIRPGEKLEWEIRSVSPLDISYRAVGGSGGVFAGFGGDVAVGSPRMTGHTGVSQLRIQEAQGVADEAGRVAAYQIALEAVNLGLIDDDENPMAYLHLGIVHAGLKDYAAAITAFDRAEAIYPAYFDEDGGTGAYRLNAWLDAYNDAQARLDAQDPAGALELFEMANSLYDRRVEAYLNIAVTAASSLGDIEVSIAAWRKALEVIASPDGNPGDDETRQMWDNDFWIMAQSNLGRLLSSTGAADEAVVVFETILERFPNNTDAQSSLALALTQSGQGGDALAVFDAILDSPDASALDYFNAGVSLFAADQFDRAVIAFEQTVAASPMYRDALQSLALTLNQMEEYEAQIPYSEKLIELDPFNDYAYFVHINALLRVGGDYQAVLDVREALPFWIEELSLQPLATGARVSGLAVNKALEPGASITLRFTFYDNAGNSVGSADAAVTISDPDVAHSFDVTFTGEEQVLGYSYEFGG